MSLANALRGPVAKLTAQFGRQQVRLVHRKKGAFDAETGKRARPFPDETVSAVIAGSERHEQDQGGTPGRARGRMALIAAEDVDNEPLAEDVLEFPTDCENPQVWKIVQVDTVEESGTAILYKCHLVR